jgi:uncharacterized protein
MRRVFADTSYWIALLNPRDELHEKARDVSQSNSFDEIVTSEMVLAELLNGFSDRGPRLRQAVSNAVEALRGNRSVVIFPQTGGQFENALRRYKDTPSGDPVDNSKSSSKTEQNHLSSEAPPTGAEKCNVVISAKSALSEISCYTSYFAIWINSLRHHRVPKSPR